MHRHLQLARVILTSGRQFHAFVGLPQRSGPLRFDQSSFAAACARCFQQFAICQLPSFSFTLKNGVTLMEPARISLSEYWNCADSIAVDAVSSAMMQISLGLPSSMPRFGVLSAGKSHFAIFLIAVKGATVQSRRRRRSQLLAMLLSSGTLARYVYYQYHHADIQSLFPRFLFDSCSYFLQYRERRQPGSRLAISPAATVS